MSQLSELASSASDLPQTIVEHIPLLASMQVPSEKMVAASESQEVTASYFRLGSKEMSFGKKGGYRAYVTRAKNEIRFIWIYFRRKQDYIEMQDETMLKDAIRRESVESLDEEWFTLEDFCREFGIPGS